MTYGFLYLTYFVDFLKTMSLRHIFSYAFQCFPTGNPT